MKAAHKSHVTKAAKLRDELADKIEASLKVDRQLVKLQDEIAALRSEISELESRAADDGLSTSDLNGAVDDLKAPKKAGK